MKVDAFIRSSSSFRDFFEKAKLLKTKEQGDVFERIVQLHLKSKPKYASELEEIWQLREIPVAVQDHLNLPNADEGIDLIAKHVDGTYWAIQAKYRSNPDHRLSWGGKGGLSTFTSLSFSTCKNIAFGLVCSTTNTPLKKTHLTGEKVGFELFNDLLELDGSDGEGWIRLKQGLDGEPHPPRKFEPLPHQRRAIQNSKIHFIEENNSRGKLIMPCGTGKSLTGFWIATAINAKNIIVAVPSLALIKQTLNVWTREYLAHGILPKWLAVCSDESAGTVDSDAFTAQVYDIGVPCVTDPELVKEFLKKSTDQPRIVFTTYQSGPVLAKMAESIGHRFDLGIMDEAHKTVGRKDKVFAHLIHEDNIGIDKRVFMTATERFYHGCSDEIVSMHNPKLYGKTFELLTFKRAIEVDNIICDYRFVTICIEHSEIQQLWKKNAYLQIEGSELNEDTTRSLASGLALRKAYSEFGIKRAISFHRSIKLAKSFADQQKKLAIAFPELTEVDCFHVSSKLSTSDRANQLRAFSSANRGLITNARCLTEGIDIPSVDCVLFADPRRSKVDIVQAAGRALRKAQGKTFGYIIVPLVIPDEVDLEEFAESTNFAQIVTTIKALAAEDERIVEHLRLISTGSTPTGDKIEVSLTEVLARRLDANLLHDSLQLKVWEKIAQLNWLPFEEAREFVRHLGLKSQKEWRGYCKSGDLPPDIPTTPSRTYENQGWSGVGDWLGTGSVANWLRDYKSYEEARNFARKLKLKTYAEWVVFVKAKKHPQDIPAYPDQTYKNDGWVSWGDWLGTGAIANQNRKYRAFEDARKFVRALKLKSISEWSEYFQKEKFPDDIPAKPDRIYKNEGWVSWGDWFGTDVVATFKMKFRSFQNAKLFVNSLGIESVSQWREYSKSRNRPVDIPANPSKTYRNEGWISWGDWLGTGTVSPNRRNFRPFAEAFEFSSNLGLKSVADWRRFCREKNLPSDIPANPDQVFKNAGWINWGNWLGTGRRATNELNLRPFEEACIFAQSLHLKTRSEWNNYCRSGKLPPDIPASPWRAYKDQGWMGIGNWLGTGTAPRFRN